MSAAQPLARLSCLLPLALLACDPERPQDTEPQDSALPDGVELLTSDKARETSPDVSDEDYASMVAGNTDFAFDMYQVLRGASQEDIFFSPISISTALAMSYAGARGTTADQLQAALGFTLGADGTHPAFDRLLLELESRAASAGEDEEPFVLSMHNDVWGQYNYDWSSEWLDIMAIYYGSGIYLLDIAGDPEGARGLINETIAEHTDDKIPELLPAGVISENTKLVLTNAILFKAAWETQFEEESTSDGSFNLSGGGSVEVPFMHGQMSGDYAAGDGWQAVSLPYDGAPVSMVILLPADGRFDEIESGLDATVFASVLSAMDSANLDLSMPRWSTDAGASLASSLQALGVEDAFTPGVADFTGLYAPGGLYIGDVIHQAVIDVNEEGTEAAAATAVVFDDTASIPEDPITVSLDRPFIYAIVDRPTRAVLFLGRLVDPS